MNFKQTVTFLVMTVATILMLDGLVVACGRINSGGALGRGQSVSSCNGKVTLIHQSDGNVVLYDQVGPIWATMTNGQATTNFVMQTDGNLVLYTAQRPIWSSGTYGRNGSFLGVQDDGNVVIYHNGSPIWATMTFWRIDTLNYMLNTSGWTLRDPSRGDAQSTRHDAGNRRFWIQKNPYEPDRWERYRYDNNRITLEVDTTSPAGDGNGTAYRTSSGAMFLPRAWRLGEVFNFSAANDYFNHRSRPCNTTETVLWKDGRHKLRYAGGINLGGELGYLPDVIIIDRYHELINSNPPVAERFWYARGYGWVRWENWDLAKPRTSDQNWDRGDVNSLLNTNPQQRVTWNDKWRQGALPWADAVCQ